MKKFALIYAVMFALTIGIPALVCFVGNNEDTSEVVNIFHSASAVIEGVTLLK